MKTTLTAIALLAVLATGTTSVNAIGADVYVGPATVGANVYASGMGAGPLHVRDNEGYQNWAYYFGANCADRPCGATAAIEAPCAVAAAAPCNTCAPQSVCVPMEQVCTTTSCDPCAGGGFNILNPFTYFG